MVSYCLICCSVVATLLDPRHGGLGFKTQSGGKFFSSFFKKHVGRNTAAMVGYNSQPRAGYNKLLSPRYSSAPGLTALI